MSCGLLEGLLQKVLGNFYEYFRGVSIGEGGGV